MSLRGFAGCIVESHSNSRDEMSIVWQIRNFFSLSGEGADYYSSDDFCFRNVKWRFRLFPKVRSQTSEWVHILLERMDNGPPQKNIVRIGITGWDDKEKKVGIESVRFGKETYDFVDLCSRSELRKQRSRLMPSDLLTFICELKPKGAEGMSSIKASVQTDYGFRQLKAVSRGNQPTEKQDASSQTDDEIEVLPKENEYSTKQDASSQTDEDIKVLEKNESSAKQGIENDIGKDFGKLLVSGENSDIVVQVRDVEFKVHQVILSVRSPVLSAMFRHETAQKATNRISISDCEPRVFKEFLHYIYTGFVQLLTKENVFGLYQVADKYLADDLKLQCLKHIQDTLCVETFCNALQLALTHGESGLLKLALDFASKNFQSILCSVEWQNFICEYPREANEILIKCYNPRS